MGKLKENPTPVPRNQRMEPAMTPESRESQLIAMATNLAEERLLAGTATSQEIVHFLKLGSMKERLEMEKLKKENELLKAKTEAIRAEKESRELFAQAIAAMKSYRVEDDEEEEE